MNGIVIVDKPTDWTSHDVVAKLRGVFRTKRIGHGGTLDPTATGVLPIFIGRATRAAEFCENAEKEYVAGIQLGIVTDTQDTQGNVLESREVSSSLSAAEIKAVLSGFLGESQQIPPMYSAVKIDGVRLYKLARQGIDIPRPARDIFISALELIDFGGSEFTIRVACSKGTYIRTLAHDIGQTLGMGGAMASLRRTKAGAFSIDTALPLNEIIESVSNGMAQDIILPTDSIFAGYPALAVNPEDTQRIKNGAACRVDGVPDGKHRIYNPDGEFLALGEGIGGALRVIKSFF
ncbi:MAG: tRNA pseudouridine(55) synthase TruB [Oscillospiraceae bacterium]|nr:tRNA pseudouridine(55) synthase TruB [Oscillospiraceae bacterium]